MAGDDLDPLVRELILRQIHSLDQLEVLLLLHSDPDRSWTAADVGAQLKTSEEAARLRLSDLHQRGFAATGDKDTFQYRPSTKATAAAVAALAAIYPERRHAVITLIFSRPPEALKSFSEAFRLKGDQ